MFLQSFLIDQGINLSLGLFSEFFAKNSSIPDPLFSFHNPFNKSIRGRRISNDILGPVASMKSLPTILHPSLFIWRDPIPREETPSFTPSSIKEDAILPMGVLRILDLSDEIRSTFLQRNNLMRNTIEVYCWTIGMSQFTKCSTRLNV